MQEIFHEAVVIAVDDTPLNILQLAGKSKVSVESLFKQGYVLIKSNVANAPKPFCLYQRLDGRGGKEIRRKLGGFKPKAYMTDGYHPYESMETKALLENAAHQSSLVHLRRTILDPQHREETHGVGCESEGF